MLYLSYSTGRRYLLCTYMYAYNKLLMAWEGVLYVEYSTRGGVERIIHVYQQEPSAAHGLLISGIAHPVGF